MKPDQIGRAILDRVAAREAREKNRGRKAVMFVFPADAPDPVLGSLGNAQVFEMADLVMVDDGTGELQVHKDRHGELG